jgi:hypothetical protein
VSRRAVAASGLLLAAVVAGCSSAAILGAGQSTNEKAIPPIVPVAAGETAQGPWRAIAYRTSDGWTCLEIVGGLGGASCGQGPDALVGMGLGSSALDQESLLTGGTAIAGAAAVAVLLDNGVIVPAAVVPVPPPVGAPGVKVFVISIPPGRTPKRVDILDSQGTAVESTDF